jgi:hypothetical protein
MGGTVNLQSPLHRIDGAYIELSVISANPVHHHTVVDLAPKSPLLALSNVPIIGLVKNNNNL